MPGVPSPWKPARPRNAGQQSTARFRSETKPPNGLAIHQGGRHQKATAKGETTTNTGEAGKTTINNGKEQSITLAAPQDASHDSMLANKVESSSNEAIPWTAASQ